LTPRETGLLTVDHNITLALTWDLSWVGLSLSYGRRPVDQFVLVSGSPLGHITKCILILSLATISCFFFL
jgi:hypothetical protein